MICPQVNGRYHESPNDKLIQKPQFAESTDLIMKSIRERCNPLKVSDMITAKMIEDAIAEMTQNVKRRQEASQARCPPNPISFRRPFIPIRFPVRHPTNAPDIYTLYCKSTC